MACRPQAMQLQARRSSTLMLISMVGIIIVILYTYIIQLQHHHQQQQQQQQQQPTGSNNHSSPLNELEAFYNNPTSAGQQAPKSERMEYLLQTPVPCQPHQFLVIYVHTAPGYHSRRQMVRSTWGNVSRWSTDSSAVTLRFVLGRAANDSDHQQRALVDEQAKHGDLVQLDFIDSYHNMTFKAVGALQWLNDYCHNTRLVMKTDDDAFVNMFSLMPRLHTVAVAGVSSKTSSSTLSTSSSSMLLLCNVWRKELVARRGKWRIDKSVWRYDHWPTFCQGIAFIMTMDFVVSAYQTVHRVPRLWLDDVYLTGMVPLAIGPSRPQYVDFNDYYVPRDQVRRFADKAVWRDSIFSHLGNNPELLMLRLWQCVEANDEGRTPPSLDEQPPTLV